MTHRRGSLAAGLAALLGLLVLTLGGCSTATLDRTATTTAATTRSAATPAAGVPARATATLREIDAGHWPASANAPGTKGGDPWQNREGRLPKVDAHGSTLRYQEWDVNPKQRGQTRDAERIITGSDRSAWYTADHYQTFTRMR